MALAIANLGLPMIASADPLENLPYAISGGAPNLDMRLRYENVDQELPATITEKASATTLRSRLGYTTGKWNNVDAQLEFENVTVLGKDNFNGTDNNQGNRRAAYPVVADPETSEINQAWLRYAAPAKTTLKVGRQRIIFDNARFIGNVGWRQHEQTYDGVLLTNAFLPKTTLNYAYIRNVYAFRVFNHSNTGVAPDLSPNRGIDGHLVNFAFAPYKALALTAYGYLLDFDTNPVVAAAAAAGAPAPIAPGNPTGDSQTIGLRVTGTVPVQDFNLSYALEYADQSDYADAPDTVDASYTLAELGASYKVFGLKLGYEVLGGDGTYGFQTPLATMHAHDGWADMFLTTPATGLERLYLQASATVEKVVLTAVYHQFSADEGGDDYGDEFDLMATRPLTDQLGIGLKYASYSGDSDAPVAATSPIRDDVSKYWAWIEYKF
ncbi:alginate export family protein [Solimonas sp. K1W22B-7]|uniref:alginate export family protein n=1 Tax=Solimonas sp. K1W22B-7 TaxID=2303331 RepID=UPI0013C49F22|nr:alginate export family protein [Solimonas sp. K1W22B-7]